MHVTFPAAATAVCFEHIHKKIKAWDWQEQCCGWTQKEDELHLQKPDRKSKETGITVPLTEFDWQVISAASSAETQQALALNKKDFRKQHNK